MAVKSASGNYNLDRPRAPQVSRVLTATRVFTGRRGGILDDGAVVVVDGKVAWVGPRGQVPDEYAALPVEDHPSATIMPGMVETHAHLGGFAYNA